MWRKIGVALIALVSTFSVVYAMNQDMFAAAPILYGSSTPISGTIKPITRDGTTYKAAKSVIYYGSNASNYNASTNSYIQDDIAWEFIKELSDGSFVLQTYDIINAANFPRSGVNLNVLGYENWSTIHSSVVKVNNSLSTLEKNITDAAAGPNSLLNGAKEGNVFTPDHSQFKDTGLYGLNNYYRATITHQPVAAVINQFGSYLPSYTLSSQIEATGVDKVNCLDGVYPEGRFGNYGVTTNTGLSNTFGVRPIMILKPDQMVFAVEPLTIASTTSTIVNSKKK